MPSPKWFFVTTSGCTRTVLIVALLSIGNKSNNFVSASVDPSADFIYRQSFHLDLTSSNFKAVDDGNQNPLFISSSTAVVQGDRSDSKNSCLYISSPTIISSVKPGKTSWSLLPHSPLDRSFHAAMEECDEDEDEQDDDNDDDGHSSMLSTSSLQRKITASAVSHSGRSRSLYTKEGVRNRTTKYGKLGASLPNTFSTSHSLWKMRGGATSVGSSPPLDWIRQVVLSAMESSVGRNLLVSAVVTLVFEAFLGHILEFLKIVMQTATNDTTTYLQVIQTITAEKGLAGLWDGFCPWGIVQAVCKGAVFGLAHASALQTLKPLAEKGYIPMALALTLAGGIGGGFQGYVLSPTLLLKTRVMTVRGL
jgi:Mitochondrial carrier protein